MHIRKSGRRGPQTAIGGVILRKLLSVWIAAAVLALSLSGCSLFMEQVGTRDEHGDVIYNDATYRFVGVPYQTVFPVGEALGKLEGGSVLYSVKGDDNRDYVVLRWWDGCSLYQKGDTVREGGDEVTALYIFDVHSNPQEGITVDDPEDVALLLGLKACTGETYRFRTYASGNCSRYLYGCYDGSLIATADLGEVAYKDGKLLYCAPETEYTEGYFEGVVIDDPETVERVKALCRLK